MGGTNRQVAFAGFLVFVSGLLVAGVAPAAGALAGRGGTTAMAGTRLSGAQRALRQQQAIVDPAADDLTITGAEFDVEISLDNLPRGLMAQDVLEAITVTAIDPFGFTTREPVVTFDGPDVFLDDLEVTASSRPPAGSVDFATVTIDFINTGLTDAEYEAIFVTYSLVLEGTENGDPSFLSGVDADGNPVRFGPGTDNGIDVSMKASGNADVPEPSAAVAALAGAAALLGLRRPRVCR